VETSTAEDFNRADILYMKYTIWKAARKRCSVCGRSDEDDDVSRILRHYTNKERDEWIPVCQGCHTRIYHEEGYYDELQRDSE
jgi:uncharacterized protein YlaI